jgi:hypothetical protein
MQIIYLMILETNYQFPDSSITSELGAAMSFDARPPAQVDGSAAVALSSAAAGEYCRGVAPDPGRPQQ